jgi:hypothetical protein
VLIPRLQGTSRDHVNSYTQKLLKILEQADMIQQRRTFLKVHQEVQVTIGVSLAPGHRPEHCNPVRPAPPRDAQDLRTATTQASQRQHLISHPTSVAPQPQTDPDQDRSRDRRIKDPLICRPRPASTALTWQDDLPQPAIISTNCN